MQGQKPLTTTNAIAESRAEIYKNIETLQKNNSPDAKFTLAFYKSTFCAALGEACTDNPSDGDKNYRASLIGKMSNLIATPYANPPASGAYWAFSGLQNAGFVPNSYAAEGIGFAAIKPLIGIWSAMRNLAYLVLVLVMLAIGFMVMFRMKLNPQTVISVESALPKIIMALLYITFSFAIAGFLIDLMYVLIVIGIAVLAKADPSLTSVDAMHLQNQYLNASFGTIWDSMFPVETGKTILGVIPIQFSKLPIIGGLTTLTSIGGALTGLLPEWINSSVRLLGAYILFQGISTFIGDKGQAVDTSKIGRAFNGIQIPVIGGSLGNLPEGVFGTILSLFLFIVFLPLTLIYGAGFILGIVVLFTMLLLLFRIFFLLFTGYLKILLLIVFSPIFMLFEAIPGRNAFSYWFKTLISELIVFPVVIFIIVLGRIIVNIYSTDVKLWQPPFLYGINPNHFTVLLGMGLIFMIPEIVKLVKEFMGVKGLPLGLQLGTFFAGAGTGVGGAMGVASQFHSLNFGLNALTGRSEGIMPMVNRVLGRTVADPATEIKKQGQTQTNPIDAGNVS